MKFCAFLLYKCFEINFICTQISFYNSLISYFLICINCPKKKMRLISEKVYLTKCANRLNDCISAMMLSFVIQCLDNCSRTIFLSHCISSTNHLVSRMFQTLTIKFFDNHISSRVVMKTLSFKVFYDGSFPRSYSTRQSYDQHEDFFKKVN